MKASSSIPEEISALETTVEDPESFSPQLLKAISDAHKGVLPTTKFSWR